ncbi:MAG TPA: ROK family protein [Polyangiaceae bacterium]|nr:ROK family protein [Polyangiaceae bacterium]
MSDSLSLGVDLGGTKIEGAVLVRRRAAGTGSTETFEVVARTRVATLADEGYDAVLARTAELVQSVAQQARVDFRSIPVGVGMPGAVTRRTKVVKNSNTACLNGRPFREDLAKALGTNVRFENDANCFAIAEARFGAGREHLGGVVFGIIMGTGVGGGVVVRGRVWDGPQSLGGEWGHHAVGPWRRQGAFGTEPVRGHALSERAPCPCGKMGCLELYASGGGAEREYTRRSGSKKTLAEMAATRAADPHADAVVGELVEAFGRGLANVIDVLDPSIVVLGGGVSNLPLLYSEGRARVEAYVFNDELVTEIVKNELGDSAGVIGAALLDEMGS